MVRALAYKELREVAPAAAGALACYLAVVLGLVGVKAFAWVSVVPAGTSEVPFTGGEFRGPFTAITVLLALALGFRQSAWESAKGTYLFLLHRPVSRDTVLLTKLATGAAVLLACAAVPILVYGWWASVPGTHPGPFDWSMTEESWRTAGLMTLLYLGAFLSGLRPGRWYGSRLLPLFGAAVVVMGLFAANWRWWAVWPVAACVAAVWVAAVGYVGRTRDYA